MKWLLESLERYETLVESDFPGIPAPPAYAPPNLPKLKTELVVPSGTEFESALGTFVAPNMGGASDAPMTRLFVSEISVNDLLGTFEISENVRLDLIRPNEARPVEHRNFAFPSMRPFNQDARLSHFVPQFEATFHAGAAESITVAVVDQGALWKDHVEFATNRVTNQDDWAEFSVHATHVTGTLAARGEREESRGVAQKLRVRSFYSGNKSDFVAAEEEPLQEDGLDRLSRYIDDVRLSNHSYGPPAGWEPYSDQSGETWTWWGRTDEEEDYRFGKYTSDCRRLDALLASSPGHLAVVAVGNNRDDKPPRQPIRHYVPIRVADGLALEWRLSEAVRRDDGFDRGLDTLVGLSVAKNALSVGAIDDLFENGIPIPGAPARVTSFTAFGPTDDGRIKPDIVANGRSVLSATLPPDGTVERNSSYIRASGTSTATPTVTGICSLLSEYFHERRGKPLTGAALKAIVLHTATDVPPAGPDVMSGWGSINAYRAGELIDDETSLIESVALDSRECLVVTGTAFRERIRVCVVWTDPPGQLPGSGVDADTPILVNDINASLISPAGTRFYPYRLDPASPFAPAKIDGENHRDNVEIIDSLSVPGTWTVVVSASELDANVSQTIAVVVSGVRNVNIATENCKSEGDEQ